MADKLDLDALEALYNEVCRPTYEPEVETSGENWHRRIHAAERLAQFHNAFPSLLAELREARGRKCEMCGHADKPWPRLCEITQLVTKSGSLAYKGYITFNGGCNAWISKTP